MKNHQYNRKKKVINKFHPKPSEKSIIAARLAMETIMGAVQLATFTSMQKPKNTEVLFTCVTPGKYNLELNAGDRVIRNVSSFQKGGIS